MGDGQELHPLSDWVFDEGKIVTYKLFSQVREISSSQAQKTLDTFAQKHAKRVLAIYLLTGGLGEGGVHTVRLVPADALEGAKSAMSPLLSCHVYSVQQVAPSSEHKLWEAEFESQIKMSHELRRGATATTAGCLEDNRYGALRGDGARRASAKPPSVPSPAAPASKPAAAAAKPSAPAGKGAAASDGKSSAFFAQAASSTKAEAEGKRADEEKKEEKASKVALIKPKGSVATMFAKQAENKATSKASEKASPPPAAKPTPAAKPEKRPTDSAAEVSKKAAKLEPSDKGASTVSKEAAEPSGAARKRSRIVCDSEDDEDEAPAKPAVPKPSAAAAAGAQEPAEPASPCLAKSTATEKASVTEPPASASGPRKRVERHKRTRTTVDADGYMVTEDYYEEMEVDGELEEVALLYILI